MVRSIVVMRLLVLALVILLTLVPREAPAAAMGDFEFPIGTRLYLYASGKNQDLAREYLSALCQQLKEDSEQQVHGVFESVTLIHQEHEDMLTLLRSKSAGPSDGEKLDDLNNLFDGLRRSEPSCLAKSASRPVASTSSATVLGLLTLKVSETGNQVKLEIVRELADLTTGQEVTVDRPRYEIAGRGLEESRKAAVTLGATYLSLATRYPPQPDLSVEVPETDRCSLEQKDSECTRLGGTIHLTLDVRGTRWASPHVPIGEIVEDCSTEDDRRRTLVHVLPPGKAPPGSKDRREERVSVRPSYVGNCVFSARLQGDPLAVSGDPLRHVEIRPKPLVLRYGFPLADRTTIRLPLKERNLVPFRSESTTAEMVRRSLRELSIIDGAELLPIARATRARLVGLPLEGMEEENQDRVRGQIAERLKEYGDHISTRLFDHDVCARLDEEIFSLLGTVGQTPTNPWLTSCNDELWRFSSLVGANASPISRVLIKRGERRNRLYQAVPALRNNYSATIDLSNGGFETNPVNILEQQDELYFVYPLGKSDSPAGPFNLILEVVWPAPSVLVTGRLSFPYWEATRSESVDSGFFAQVNFLEHAVDANIGFTVGGPVTPGAKVTAEWEVGGNISVMCMAGVVNRIWSGAKYGLGGRDSGIPNVLDSASSCPTGFPLPFPVLDLQLGGGYSSRLNGAFLQLAVPFALQERVRLEFVLRKATISNVDGFGQIGLRLRVDLDVSPVLRKLARALSSPVYP